MNLVFYYRERARFPDTYAMVITDDKAVFIANSVANHFGFVLPPIIFWDRIYGEACDSDFKIPHNPHIGGLIHELAHVKDFNDLIEQKKKARDRFQYPTKMHCKRLMRIIEEMYNFCKVNNFFQNENI